MIKDIALVVVFLFLFFLSVPFNLDFLAGGLCMAIYWWTSISRCSSVCFTNTTSNT
jgi:hypothetical protein